MGLEACSWGLVLVLAKPQLNLLAPHLKKKKNRYKRVNKQFNELSRYASVGMVSSY